MHNRIMLHDCQLLPKRHGVAVTFDHAWAYTWSNMARISHRKHQRVASKHGAYKNDDRTHRGAKCGWGAEDPFTTEFDQTNIHVGPGKGLDIFNDNLLFF